MRRATIFLASALFTQAATNFFDYDVEDADDEHVMQILLDTEMKYGGATDGLTLAGYGSQIVEGSSVFMGGSGDAFVGSAFTDGPDGPMWTEAPAHTGDHTDAPAHTGDHTSAPTAHTGVVEFEGSADSFAFEGSGDDWMPDTPVLGSTCATVTPCCSSPIKQAIRINGVCTCVGVVCPRAADTHSETHLSEGSGMAFEGSGDAMAMNEGSGDWEHEFAAGSAEAHFEGGSGGAIVFGEGSGVAFGDHTGHEEVVFEGSGHGEGSHNDAKPKEMDLATEFVTLGNSS